MPIDPSVLLGAKGIELPSQLAMAGQGATLAELMTKVQQGQLGLEQTRQQAAMYADPRMAQAMAAMMGGGGQPQPGAPPGAPGAAPGPAGAPGDDTSQTVADLLRSFPLAAPGALKSLNDLQKTQAEIGELRAKAGKSIQETKEIGVVRLGNAAAALASQDGPVTPMQMSTLIAQAKSLNTPQELLTAMPSIMDQSGVKTWAASLAAAATNPQQQAEIWKIKTETPANVAEKTAQAGLANTTAKYIPANTQAHVTEAGAAAMNAGTERGKFLEGQTGVNPLTGLPYQIAPQSVNNPTAVVTTPTAPGGAPAPQIGASLTQAEFAKGGADVINKAAPQVQTASELQQQIVRLKALDQQGIYSGPLGASKFWKDLTGILAPMMSPEDRAKVENSQAFNAEANTIVGKYMQSIMGGRMSRGALIFGGGTKPSDIMQPGARDVLYDSMYNGAQRTIDYWKQAGQFAAQNPGAPLTNFAPQYTPDMRLTAAGPVDASKLKPPTPEEVFNAKAAMREAAKRGMAPGEARAQIQAQAIKRGFDPSGLGI